MRDGIDGYAGAGEALKCGLHQARLHLVRRQAWILLKQQRYGATYHRGRHAGAAQRVVEVRGSGAPMHAIVREGNVVQGIRLRECTVGGKQRDYLVTRSDDIGLDGVIKKGRTLRTVTGDQVI